MTEDGNRIVADEGKIKAKVAASPRKPAAPKSTVKTAPVAAAKAAAAKPVVTPIAAATPAAVETPAAPTVTPAQVIEAVTSPAIQSDSIDAPAAAPAPLIEEIVKMATVNSPADAAEKIQAVFGDVSGRVKSAVEKSTKLGEEFADFAKGNVEAVIASSKVAAKASETLGQDAAEYGKKHFEAATAAFKSFASVKSPTELFQLQSDYAKATFDSLVAETSRFSETLMKVAGDVAQPISSRYALAAEKIKASTSL